MLKLYLSLSSFESCYPIHMNFHSKQLEQEGNPITKVDVADMHICHARFSMIIDCFRF